MLPRSTSGYNVELFLTSVLCASKQGTTRDSVSIMSLKVYHLVLYNESFIYPF